jgi:hypothetical protein
VITGLILVLFLCVMSFSGGDGGGALALVLGGAAIVAGALLVAGACWPASVECRLVHGRPEAEVRRARSNYIHGRAIAILVAAFGGFFLLCALG